jgi:hypothetical protein
MQSPHRSGFGTEDEVLAWVCWRDPALVDRVASELGCISFRELNWRRQSRPAASRGEWRFLDLGEELARLYCLPVPYPEEPGSPADLYAACSEGKIIAWGRFGKNGKMEKIPVAEWTLGKPKDWTDIQFKWTKVYGVFKATEDITEETNASESRDSTDPNEEMGHADPRGEVLRNRPKGTSNAPIAAASLKAAETPVAPGPVEPTEQVGRLANWIFTQYPTEKRCKFLYERARKEVQLGEFRHADFVTAYRLVYATQRHRPPATGWPLRSPYKERAFREMGPGESL